MTETVPYNINVNLCIKNIAMCTNNIFFQIAQTLVIHLEILLYYDTINALTKSKYLKVFYLPLMRDQPEARGRDSVSSAVSSEAMLNFFR